MSGSLTVASEYTNREDQLRKPLAQSEAYLAKTRLDPTWP